jgi:protein-ribulosamine 3-kinase
MWLSALSDFPANLRKPLEEAVARRLERPWRVRSARDLSDLASHPCAILADGDFAVFAKFSAAPDAARQFEIELAGLDYLSKTAGVNVPTPIGIVAVENGTLLVMEALEEIERAPVHWRQIGLTLARLHRVKAERCGFHMHNFFGPLPQDNTPAQDWAAFYAERRLRPRLKMAVDSSHIPPTVAAQVEKVIERLPELCGPESAPALLHGDAQRNNWISAPDGVYMIDPAVHYGSPELDLAYLDLWQPVPQDVFDGYQDEALIAPGFYERRDLWKLSGYLAAVAVEGAAYLGKLENALRSYL